MGIPARALLFLLTAAAVAAPAAAVAQPFIMTVQTPPANERGWTNSPAKVEFVCIQAINCSDDAIVTSEGEQRVEGTALGHGGATASATVDVKTDWTAPAVTIQSPARAGTTAGVSIAIIATAIDAIAGTKSATCNGRPAVIGDGGEVRCEVPLAVGANDVVVEVSDHADNSGSAGFRIVRTGTSPHLTIVPEVMGMIVGQVTTFQVHDAAGLPARRVAWQVDRPSVGDMSADGRHVLTARAPGTMTITATTGDATAKAIVTIYPGDRLPMGSTRWTVGSSTVFQTPDTQPLQPTTENIVGSLQKPGAEIRIESINWSTGWLNWRERPAANEGERSAGIRELGDGGGLMVVESLASGRSALVRSAGATWRYQSAGQILPQMSVSRDGTAVVMERTDGGFTRLVVFDVATGRVAVRRTLPTGYQVALNVRCNKGAHGARVTPAQVGPLNPDTRKGIHFGLIVPEDTENFAVCGEVSGTLKRTVMVATIDDGPHRVDTAATIEVPAGGAAPVIELFEVTIDRRGAKLLPWRRVTDTGARESRVTRVADNGTAEFALPGAGKVWLSGRDDDLAVTTDGTNLVGFDVVTGAVVVSQAFERGVRVMSVDKGRVLYEANGMLSAADIPIPKPR